MAGQRARWGRPVLNWIEWPGKSTAEATWRQSGVMRLFVLRCACRVGRQMNSKRRRAWRAQPYRWTDTTPTASRTRTNLVARLFISQLRLHQARRIISNMTQQQQDEKRNEQKA